MAVANLESRNGDVSEVRRYKCKPELQLLVTSNNDIFYMTPGRWQSMGCSGLRPQELRCLAVRLFKPGVPAQFDEFKKMVRTRIGARMPTEHQIAELCEPPSTMMPFRERGAPPAPSDMQRLPPPPPPPPKRAGGPRPPPPTPLPQKKGTDASAGATR
jgi:hypothetical protein